MLIYTMHNARHPGSEHKVHRMTISTIFTPRNEHRLLALMLLSVHLSVWWDFGGAFSRSLMLVHLGLFLLWQPLFSRERNLEFQGVAVFVVGTVAFVVWLNWSLMTFWLLLLTGFIGGRVTAGSRDRYVYLASLVFVVSEVLIGCIPPMFDVRSLSAEFKLLFRFGLLAVPLALFFVPPQTPAVTAARPVHFLHGLMTSLLTIVLASGSLLSMYAAGTGYPVALTQTVLIMAGFLLAISWLWTPLAGVAGIGQLLERYLLNIGTPFEDWLGTVATAAARAATPDQFMEKAMRLFEALPWVAGIEWRRDPEVAGTAGKQSSHAFKYSHSGIEYVVYTHRAMGVALQLHCQLLLRLVSHFRLAKERERDIAEGAQLQAIYKTGARITHDVKNLLQSLGGLTIMVENEDEYRQREVQQILRRQLPPLTRRLRLALDKLQAPGDVAPSYRRLESWWQDFTDRNDRGDIHFESAVERNPEIPADLFDSVVENLLENARSKRQSEPGIDITVRLEANHRHTALSVRDSGSPVDAAVASTLFRAPVKSKNGLGIGLYQAAAHAKQLGYELRLGEMSGNGVCFVLRRDEMHDVKK